MDREHAKQIIKYQLKNYLEQKHGIDTEHPFICLNPEHDDHNPSMSLYTDDTGAPRVHCFSCRASYDIFDLIGIDYNIKGQDPKETESLIFAKAYELYGLEVDKARTTAQTDFNEAQAPSLEAELDLVPVQQEKKQKEAVTLASVCVQDFTDQVQKAHEALLANDEALKYLHSRGLSLELIKRYKLGYTPNGCNDLLPVPENKSKIGFLYPYVLPYPSYNGRFNFFLSEIGKRDGQHPKYIKIKGLTAPLFNERYINEDNRVIFVCEGIYDALSVEIAGQKAIAFVGVGHKRFIELCKTYKPKCTFVLSLDNDGTGSKAQEALKEGLRALNIPFIEATPRGAKDFNEMLTTDSTGFFTFIRDVTAKASSVIAQNLHLESALNTVDRLMGDLNSGKEIDVISTGLKSLDNVLDGGLNPYLCIVGAMSSSGKTTLTLQIADNVASKGRDVMIFSLEMSARELISKSISRLTFMRARKKDQYLNDYKALCTEARSSKDILRGYTKNSDSQKETIQECSQTYRNEYAPHIFILEGTGNVTAQTICDTVNRHVKTYGTKPLVIVDYLQILSPLEDKQTEKQNTDRAVNMFKRLSRDNDICVMLISSFNRDNYTKDANMASFKESGGIEYSSDVLLGLQFKGTAKIKDFNEAKQRTPRNMELIVLKNRNGETGARLDFDYYPRFNTFCEPRSLTWDSEFLN